MQSVSKRTALSAVKKVSWAACFVFITYVVWRAAIFLSQRTDIKHALIIRADINHRILVLSARVGLDMTVFIVNTM
jgi:hypothetical protein